MVVLPATLLPWRLGVQLHDCHWYDCPMPHQHSQAISGDIQVASCIQVPSSHAQDTNPAARCMHQDFGSPEGEVVIFMEALKRLDSHLQDNLYCHFEGPYQYLLIICTRLH